MAKPKTKKTTRKFSRKTGLPPGTLVHTGEKRTETVRITLFRYNNEGLLEEQLRIVEEALTPHDPGLTTWLNIDGLHDISVVETIGRQYQLHPLLLEDILNTNQPPKCEDYETYLFVVVRMLTWNAQTSAIQAEQVSLILGRDSVISFQEQPGDVFELIRDRLRANKGRLRKCGADYLVYALVDAIVDHYFVILDKIGERIEALEDALEESPDTDTLHAIHALKRELINLRRAIWPLRETINSLIKTESDLIADATIPYLRDVHGHCIQVIETIESYRDIISGMLDLYLSILSNRMNNVMKVLTIISTIFIPLTFIAGVYGMNFDYMPELASRWGYPAVWAVMLGTAGVMLWFFRKNKWL